MITMLAHPFTIFLMTILAGSGGFVIKTVFDLSKDNSTLIQTSKGIKEILDKMIERQDHTDECIGGIRHDLDKLQGEHDMVKRASNIIGSHDFKKK